MQPQKIAEPPEHDVLPFQEPWYPVSPCDNLETHVRRHALAPLLALGHQDLDLVRRSRVFG